jgi:hypothetical protein
VHNEGAMHDPPILVVALLEAAALNDGRIGVDQTRRAVGTKKTRKETNRRANPGFGRDPPSESSAKA